MKKNGLYFFTENVDYFSILEEIKRRISRYSYVVARVISEKSQRK